MRQRDDGKSNRIATILLDDDEATPIGGEPVYLDGAIAGKTTSAAYGYRIGKPLAIADLSNPEALVEGVAVTVDIARKHYSGCVTLNPAFDPKGSRMRSSAPV